MIVPGFLRLAFRLHAVYFFVWATVFDFFVEPFGRIFGLEAPRTIIGWVGTGVASGGLLTAGVLFLLASFQRKLPRFVIAVALVQTTFNLYHDVVWFRVGAPMELVLLDAAVIGMLFIAYLAAWRMSRAAQTSI
ncbi:hypothetical protein HYW67_00040 [Candidatus Parcubacteria bacterium]|nr:hypothetical protein [Candidatus Parcubacteria bacterium]